MSLVAHPTISSSEQLRAKAFPISAFNRAFSSTSSFALSSLFACMYVSHAHTQLVGIILGARAEAASEGFGTHPEALTQHGSFTLEQLHSAL